MSDGVIQLRRGRPSRLAAALILSLIGTTSAGEPAERPAVLTTAGVRRDVGADRADELPAGVVMLEGGGSTRELRNQALRALPLRELGETHRATANQILRSLSLHRRLPTLEFEVDDDVYRYFTTNPDVAVSIWRALGISTFEFKPTSDGKFLADAGDGSVGVIEVLHQSETHQLIVCNGRYRVPFIANPITAHALIHVEKLKVEKTADASLTTHQADVFVSFPSDTVEFAAKLISPVSNVIADRNFKQLTMFLHMMSLAMVRQPGWIESLSTRLSDIEPRRRHEFLEVAAKVFIAGNRDHDFDIAAPTPPLPLPLPIPLPLAAPLHDAAGFDGTWNLLPLSNLHGGRKPVTAGVAPPAGPLKTPKTADRNAVPKAGLVARREEPSKATSVPEPVASSEDVEDMFR